MTGFWGSGRRGDRGRADEREDGQAGRRLSSREGQITRQLTAGYLTLDFCRKYAPRIARCASRIIYTFSRNAVSLFIRYKTSRGINPFIRAIPAEVRPGRRKRSFSYPYIHHTGLARTRFHAALVPRQQIQYFPHEMPGGAGRRLPAG